MGKLSRLKEGLERAAKTLADYKTRVVYHGSPHDFDAFDLNKIGTGEGAQAYGHGLYFTESDDIAKYYRDSLTNVDPEDVGKIDISGGPYPFVNTDGEYDYLLSLMQWNRDADDLYDATRKSLESQINDSTVHWSTRDEAKRALDQLTAMKEAGYKVSPYKGKLYRAEIPTSDYMLDWDKPLSEQPEAVQRTLDKASKDDFLVADLLAKSKDNKAYDGADFYLRLKTAKGSDGDASNYLKSLGIVGINYIGDSSGVRNAVVFDDKLVKILEKGNADPRLLAALGITAGGVAMAMPQDAEAGVTDDVVRAVAKAGDLDMSQAARMSRAAEQGYTVPLYHGTTSKAPIEAFDLSLAGKKTGNPNAVLGVFTTPAPGPEGASRYASPQLSPDPAKQTGAVYPLLGKVKNPYRASYKEMDDMAMEIFHNPKDPSKKAREFRQRLIDEGYDSIIARIGGIDEVIVLDPANLRSVNAKFDPANIGKNDLLGSADPRILAPTAAAAAGAGMLAADPAAYFDFSDPGTMPASPPALPPEYNEFARRRAAKRPLWDQVKEVGQAGLTVGSAVAGGVLGDLSRLGGYINPFMPVERTEAGAQAIEDRMQYIPNQPNRYLEGLGGFIEGAEQDLQPVIDAWPQSIPGKIYNALPERAQGLLRIGADLLL